MDVMTDAATHCRVLVVEDHADSCEALKRAIARFGHEVQCALNFDEAVWRLGERYDCLILDLKLPGGDGVTLLRYIRDHGLALKVAVVTGVDDGPLVTDAILLKPDAFFTKPVDFSEVVGWVGSVAAGGSAGIRDLLASRLARWSADSDVDTRWGDASE